MHSVSNKFDTDQDQENPDPKISDEAFSESALGCVEVESDVKLSMPNLISDVPPKKDMKLSFCKDDLPEVDFDG